MIEAILKWCFSTRWTIGFIEDSLEIILKPNSEIKVKWLDFRLKNRWFADPFILDVNDREICLLVEEYYDPIHRGRIARMIVDRANFKILSLDTVLTLPTHLSFPAIKRENDKIFIYPENGASGKLIIYEYDIATNKCHPIKNICDGPLADAILTNVFGEEKLFATEMPNHNGDTLNVYKKQPDGIFCLNDSIKFEGNVARNAGDWFKIGETIYRPAQDCNETYGGAVIIQEIVKSQTDGYQFNNVKRITSSNSKYLEGCHTFNYHKGIAVIDAKGYRHPNIVECWKNLKKIIH